MPLPHWLAPPAPHTLPAGQVPQSIVLPQPSVAMPQLKFWLVHVFMAQVDTHWPGMLFAPHVSPLGQLPQSMVPPQVSPCMPHMKPSCVHVFAVQPPVPQTFGVTPYRYTVVNGRTVLIEPRSRRIVQVVE